ncbi:MAG: hypothetical protein H7641_11700 [Candidatus Heimdallarchaeota archaeon]|nr:hypothetical protein [Candidatus Heimdallarchaeota archaeon]MCK4878224.1 hypothetical protein [Candidatus Heimdallarchaeota archaeon]
MVTKKELIKWAKIFSLIGGVLFVLGGLLLFIDYFLTTSILPDIARDIIIKTVVFSVLENLSEFNFILVLAILGVAFGAISIIIVNAEISDLATGIMLIIIGILGLGFPGLFLVIGGIIYIIASTRKR